MINQARVKRGMYFDSIVLMQVARALSEMEEVEDAALVMATATNLQLLADAGLAPFLGLTVSPGEGDVLMVVRASDETHAEAALEAAEARLLRSTREAAPARAGEMGRARQPHSLEAATAEQTYPPAGVAVISVPGMYAALEARQALRAGLHVFLFSDNVGLEEEIALKQLGAERGLLVMGPDCGTARLNGAGLGFVNVVPDGPVGIIGASGTGMQQVMCLLAQAGYGISQAIGCGGRDLSAEVGAMTTLQALRLLQSDAETRVIVLISKPPDPSVAERVLEVAASGEKAVVAIFLGADPTLWQGKYGTRVHIVSTLTEAARVAASLCETGKPQLSPVARGDTGDAQTRTGSPVKDHPAALSASAELQTARPPYLAALFSGGTLCDEALHIWSDHPGPVYSNIPLNPAWRWRETGTGSGHYALDLGADEYTRGRPHPMIDPEARLKYLRKAASDPQTGVILLDIVLGYCAHPDPAAVYGPVIQASLQQATQAGRRLNYVISLCGTEGDPQQLSRQESRLRAAGAEVYTSNAEAARRCLELLTKLQRDS